MRTAFSSIVALGIVIGCSGGSGSTSGGTGAAAGSITAMCQSFCGWRDRCGKTEPDCLTECNGDLSRSDGKLSSAYTGMFERCFQGLACSENDDACVANFGGADPAYPNLPEVTACMERRTECSQPAPEGDGGSVTQPSTAFSDDYCLSLAALTASARADADACRSQPCAGVRDCLIQAGAFNY